MDFLKDSAAVAGLFAALSAHPQWLCLAVGILVLPKTIEAVAKLIQALAEKKKASTPTTARTRARSATS